MGSLKPTCIGKTRSGELVSFQSKHPFPLKSLKVHFSPVQQGTGDPSPTNVRLITGRTGASACRTGKNLFDKNSLTNGYFIGANGGLSKNGSWGYEYICVKGMSKVTVSGSYTNSAARFCFFDKDKNYLSAGGNTTKGNKTLTVPTGAYWLGISSNISPTSGNRDDRTLQVEEGTKATTYEPFGATLTANWQDSQGTIYGGYVDLISGELVQEWVCRDLSTFGSISAPSLNYAPWNHLFSVGQYVANKGWEKKNGRNNFMIDCIKTVDTTTGISNYQAAGVSNTYNVYIYDDTISTVAEFKEKYAGHYLAYPTKYPTTYQLSPQTLKTLIGTNNIWSNEDSVDVETYLFEPVQQTYKKFFMSEPHLVSASGDLITFNTDMKAPLKECKIGFSPIQLGEGDPSPENVREIQGWTGIEINRCGKNFCSAATGAEMREKWKTSSGGSQSKFLTLYRLPTNQDFTLQTKVLEYQDTVSNLRLYFRGASTVLFTSTANPVGVHSISQKPTSSGEITISHNSRGLSPDYYNVQIADTQLELGTVATEYEPYVGITIPVDWTSEAGTIYGGYLDLVRGEVVETLYSPKSWRAVRGANQYGFITYADDLSPKRKSNGVRKCNCISNYGSISIANVKTWTIESQSGNGKTYVAIPDDVDVSTIQYYYEIAEPIHYPLTPQILKTLKGLNNLWSSANGQLEIKYWKH